MPKIQERHTVYQTAPCTVYSAEPRLNQLGLIYIIVSLMQYCMCVFYCKLYTNTASYTQICVEADHKIKSTPHSDDIIYQYTLHNETLFFKKNIWT